MAQKSSTGSNTVRAVIFLIVAVVAGIAATIVIWQLFVGYQERIRAANKPISKQWVIVAASDLYQGVAIRETDLFAIEIPPKFLPMDGKPTAGLFDSPEHVIGRFPRERILANEFIREDRLADPEAGVGLNAVIPRGMRALSVNIAGDRALSGFLRPGNYVDLLVSAKPEGGQETETHVLLQAVYVLAVNDRMKKPEAEPAPVLGPNGKPRKVRKKAAPKRRKMRPSVTLLVTPSHAEQVAHAERIGRIHLLLRNDLDFEVQETEGITKRDINPDRSLQPESDKESPGTRAPVTTPRPRPVARPTTPKPTTETVTFRNGQKEGTIKFKNGTDGGGQ